MKNHTFLWSGLLAFALAMSVFSGTAFASDLDNEVEGNIVIIPEEETVEESEQTDSLDETQEPESEEELIETDNLNDEESVVDISDDDIVTLEADSNPDSDQGEENNDTGDPVPGNYTGFWKDPASGDWYYYTNGKIATGKTDVMEGTVDGKSGWWNVVKGKVTKGETVAENSIGWWYINSDGKVDFSYKGFARNQYGWWYIEGGKVVFSTNSVIQDTKKKVDGTSSWWYVLGGKVQTGFTGLADYANPYGWWYISNGKVTFNVTTVAENKYGWWYVKDSKVIFMNKGFAKNQYGWWYIEGGKVIFSKNSVIQDTGKNIDSSKSWWYVTGGKVQTGFTGLADYANDYGWWYINNGKVTFNVDTIAQNKNGWYYVKGSKVDFSYTGAAKNQYGWWYVSNGKVDFNVGTVIQEGSDWVYYSDGKRNTSYTGVAPNEYGWWYVYKGKVVFDDALTYAAQFVGAHSSTSASASSKLSSCFTYMRNHYSYTRIYGTPTASELPSYAITYFTKKTGNCYAYATSVAYIAKVLGYDVRVAEGQVQSNGEMTAHGWCELKSGGTWHILDVNFNVYMKTMSQYPRKLVADRRYSMSVSGEGATWK